ncbi:hypothetical protein F5Y10DRAFT_211089 [Nemania abortiva]|nr:hypothetical protein F5Y10DRAFT_211089 [Nemania abortiva]
MHWCASIGTNYRMLKLSENNHFSRNTIVIVFIFLSFGVALIVAGVVAHEAWVSRRNMGKARHVVLAAAIFDSSGRILVRPDGLLPSEKITDAYIEKAPGDTFSIENPLFQWMFQASRNWNDLSGMIAGMANHVAHLERNGSGRSVRLIRENGELIEDYDVIFRELFCLAAASLATRLQELLPSVGVLWDSILPTGKARQYHPRENLDDSSERGESMSIRESSRGLGSLMFLVRRVECFSKVRKLEAAGFRFADVRQVSSIIRSGMHIETPNLSQTLADMAAYTRQSTTIDPTVHLGFFGIRARLHGHGFDVLVEKGERNYLPASKLPLERLEPWHIEFLRQYDGSGISSLRRGLTDASRGQPPSEASFASSLADAIRALRSRVGDPGIFDEATFSCRTVQVPYRDRLGSAGEYAMMVLHFIIPIHYPLCSSNCEFVPLNFFKVHQMMYKGSPYQAAFTQHLHRELAPAIKAMPTTTRKPSRQQGSRPSARRLTLGRDSWKSSIFGTVDRKGHCFPNLAGRRPSKGGSEQTSLTTSNLWGLGRSSSASVFSDTPPDSSTDTNQEARYASSLGGILVSQEIKVAISQAEETSSRSSQDRPQSRDPGLLLPQPPSASAPPPQRKCHTETKIDSGHGFELEPVTKANTERQVEQALVSTVVASGSANEVTTFVDELFSICVELR